RVDETIMFNPLSREDIKQIVTLQLDILKGTLEQNQMELEISDAAVDWLAQLGYDPQFGARPLKRVIQKRILNELSKQILSGNIRPDSKVKVDLDKSNNFTFESETTERVES
ncbi:MAG: type VI secretion system ATPase TssH, partial [Bacteroidia bacterium]|nr:type VI secretion system ATPase TssH [Bacteroidia bacterium]